jgi:hypothetical protein
MSTITVKVPTKNGEYLKVIPVPANHSEETRFGPVDVAVVSFFLIGLSGLIMLLLLN